MQRKLIISALVLAGALVAASSSALYAGQAKAKANLPPAAKPPASNPARVPAAAPQTGKQAKQVPAEALDRLLKMSPGEREKALSKLPAAQRKRAQNQLDNLDRLNPAQRQQQIDRLRELEQLPQPRQQAVRTQIQSMNGLSIADQREYLRSSGFGQSFSPQEQEIIKERYPAATSDVVRPTDKLVPARRQAVNQETQRIRAMTFAERRQALHDPEFAQKFSPEEQEIIRNNFPNAAK